jgi:hypothetical protein
VEELAEPVGTEGWTHADLLEKWTANPRIYYNVLSEIPAMLGVSASASCALLKRFKLPGVGLRRPLKDEQLRNLFGPGRGLVKRKVYEQWFLALLNPGDGEPNEVPSRIFLPNKARRSESSSSVSTSSSMTPSRSGERTSTSAGLSRRKATRPPVVEAGDESSTDSEDPFCAECSFMETRLQQVIDELERARATAESEKLRASKRELDLQTRMEGFDLRVSTFIAEKALLADALERANAKAESEKVRASNLELDLRQRTEIFHLRVDTMLAEKDVAAERSSRMAIQLHETQLALDLLQEQSLNLEAADNGDVSLTASYFLNIFRIAWNERWSSIDI